MQLDPLEPRRLLATFTVSNALDGGAGSLRQAILDAEANPDADLVQFAIPGTGPHVIALTSPLPTLTQPITIDGYTQPGSSVNTLGAAALGSNAILRVEIDGTLAGNTPLVIQQISGSSAVATIRGISIYAGAGHDAVRVLLTSGKAVLEGNFLGLNAAGAPAGNTVAGVRVLGNLNTIGGSNAATRNVIGNCTYGVLITGTQNTVANNLIGQNAALLPRPNGTGVWITGVASRNFIGSDTGAGNLIASNNGAGVAVVADGPIPPAGNDIVGNSMHSNGGPGIDLGNDGVTANDDDDSDAGPNELANAPTVTAVDRTFGFPGSRIFCTIQTRPSLTVLLDFYLSDAPDPSGFGEGKTWLGGKNLIVNNQGFASTTFDASTFLPVGGYVTATATLLNSSAQVLGTSEFSNVFQIDRGPLVVTNVADVGAGSLRQAMLDANANVGPDRIHFNIPGSGPHVIQPLSPLPTVQQMLTIDGTTQPGTGTTPRIVLDGSLLPTGTHDGLRILADACVVRGLTISGFSGAGVFADDGDELRLEACQIGTTPDGLSHAGVGSGVVLLDSWNSRVGASGSGNRNVFSAGLGSNHGPAIDVRGSTNSLLVRNTSIGVNRGNTAPLGSTSTSPAVWLRASGLNTVGGTSLSDGNAIGGWNADAISVTAGSFDIRNNRIGVASNNTTPLGNLASGIRVNDASGDILNNRIAFNASDGVAVLGNSAASIYSNAIHDNAGLGIDLLDDGVTPNDPDDADAGPNGLLNFPVITRARRQPDGSILVTGTLRTTPDTVVFLDLYSDTTRDPSTHGEGRNPVDFTSVTTDPTGFASFSFTTFAVIPGQFVSMTADTVANGTSEFSRSVRAYIPGDMNGDGQVNNQDIAPFVQMLTDPAGYAIAFPLLDGQMIGDINDDGTMNNQDIAPFVSLLTGSRPAQVMPIFSRQPVRVFSFQPERDDLPRGDIEFDRAVL
jgi:hypothetical protein